MAARLSKRSRAERPSKNARLPLPVIEHPQPHDMRALFARGKPVIIRGLVKPRLDWAFEQEDDFEMFVLRGKMNAAAELPATVSFQELRKNLEQEKASNADSALMDLDCFFSSDKLKARFADYKKTPLYACVNTAALLPKVARRLDHSYSSASHIIDEWQGRMGYLWVGASTGSLHYDEFDNLLCQISGRKKVILIPLEHTFAFSMGSILDVFPNHSGFNASFFTDEVRAQHPSMQGLPYFEADLGPGDTLLIPAGMLHAPCGDLDSVSANLFATHGPAPCARSWWLLKRLAISTGIRKLFHAKLAHHDYSQREAKDIATPSCRRASLALDIDHRDLGDQQGTTTEKKVPPTSPTTPTGSQQASERSACRPFMCKVEVSVEAKNRDKFLQLMQQLCEPSRRELGCLRYDLVQVHDEPNRFFLFEEWRSVDDLERHKHTDHFRTFAPKIFEIATCTPTKLLPVGKL